MAVAPDLAALIISLSRLGGFGGPAGIFSVTPFTLETSRFYIRRQTMDHPVTLDKPQKKTRRLEEDGAGQG